MLYSDLPLRLLKVKTCLIRSDWRAHVISPSSSCWSTWSHESRVQRKNPTLEKSRSGLVFESKILETLSSRRPRCVNPNSSNGIIGRLSFRISLYRISPDERESNWKTNTHKTKDFETPIDLAQT